MDRLELREESIDKANDFIAKIDTLVEDMLDCCDFKEYADVVDIIQSHEFFSQAKPDILKIQKGLENIIDELIDLEDEMHKYSEQHHIDYAYTQLNYAIENFDSDAKQLRD